MRLPLIQSNDPLLRTPATPVADPTAVTKLVTDMYETLKAEVGVGLAAPQVGVSSRVFVTEVDGVRATFINPELVWSSSRHVPWEEGCLSLPRLFGEVIRPAQVKMKAFDIDGRERIYEGDKLLARVMQHELDHLDGILFPDRMADVSKLRTISEEEWANRKDGSDQHTPDVE